jgi:hypothetical protein
VAVLVPDLSNGWMIDDDVGFVMSWDERALASSMAAAWYFWNVERLVGNPLKLDDLEYINIQWKEKK